MIETQESFFPHTGEEALHVQNLTKVYGGTYALDSVDLRQIRGRVHALVGGNGSGKSTLIKILAGVVPVPSGGKVSVFGSTIEAEHLTPAWAHNAGLRFVHQDLGLFEQLTAAENLAVSGDYPTRLGRIGWKTLNRNAGRILDSLEVDINPGVLVSGLRPADRTLLAIARALGDSSGVDAEHARRLLVLDEPTARLPRSEAGRLLDSMRNLARAGHSIVFVSHHLDEVLDVADDISALRDGRLVFEGPARDLDTRALATLIAGRAVSSEAARTNAPTAEAGLTIRAISGGPIEGIDLTVRHGEVVGIAGLTGSGRTSLLEMLFGARHRSGRVCAGQMVLGANGTRAAMAQGFGYVPEDRPSRASFAQLDVVENLTIANLQRHRGWNGLRPRSEREYSRATLRRYSVKATSLRAPMSALSGGNQQKVIIARWLERNPRVLLLDEPTQGIDVGARADLHSLIAAHADTGACILLVSSDTSELLTLSDRIVVIDGGRVTDERPRGEATREWLDDHFYRTEQNRSRDGDDSRRRTK